MSILTKLPYSLALLATVAFSAAPAHAQFEGAGNQDGSICPMMELILPPMMQRMTSKIGNRVAHRGLLREFRRQRLEANLVEK